MREHLVGKEVKARSLFRRVAKQILLVLPPVRILYQELLSANARNEAFRLAMNTKDTRLLDEMSMLRNEIYDLKELSVGLERAISACTEASHSTAESSYSDRDIIVDRINYVNHNLYLHLKEASRLRELYYRDVMIVLDWIHQFMKGPDAELETSKPVAIDTDDHIFPWGTANDNTRSPRFVTACERHFNRGSLTFMDLGCSGGGLVLDFVLRGHTAYGIEGSDFSKKAQRAEWRILNNRLYTSDITVPFYLRSCHGQNLVQCDVISAWEVMEHIAEADLPTLFANVLRHLKPDGLFVGSIALVDDKVDQAQYHRTVRPQSWWQEKFSSLGMLMLDNHEFEFEDFCRGTGNGPLDPNYRETPEVGFHYIAVKS